MFEEFLKSLTDDQKKALAQALDQNSKEAKINTVSDKPRPQEDEFMMQIRKPEKEPKRMPVNERKHFNQFVDDRSEAIGKDFATPKIQPTNRERPPTKKVKQVCKRCNRTVEVHPTHARDWFLCDRCIGAV